MRYMVKCPYCDKTYVVNANASDADFACKSCGAQNGKDDIVEKIERTVNVRYSSGSISWDGSPKDGWDAIKDFDVSQYDGADRRPLEEKLAEDETAQKFLHVGLPFILILLGVVVVFFLSAIGSFLG